MGGFTIPTTDPSDFGSGGAPPQPPPSYAPPDAGQGGWKGALQGIVRKLPRAFATISAARGNPYPLRDIEEQEQREDRERQQAFTNTITGQREQRAQQMYDYQLKNFQAELQKRTFEQQEAQRKQTESQQLNIAHAIAARVPPEMIHPDGQIDASKLSPDQARQYLEVLSGKEFGKAETMTLQDGSVVQRTPGSDAWTPAMLRLPNPAFAARAQARETNPPLVDLAGGKGFTPPASTVDVPMVGQPKATNVKELLQAQINQEAQAGNHAKVAELQQRLKDIDPTGEERIRLAEDAAQRAREAAERNKNKFDVDYPADASGKRVHNTGAGKSRADAAVALLPVIKRVRELLNDPDVIKGIGVLPGSTSEVERKLGNLPRKVRELYGTLKSEYSLAGTMHGWRAIQVAEEFEKAYGGLRSNAESLRGGLDAMETTAHAVMGAVNEDSGDGNAGSSSSSPTRPPRAGYKWQRNKITHALREVPISGAP